MQFEPPNQLFQPLPTLLKGHSQALHSPKMCPWSRPSRLDAERRLISLGKPRGCISYPGKRLRSENLHDREGYCAVGLERCGVQGFLEEVMDFEMCQTLHCEHNDTGPHALKVNAVPKKISSYEMFWEWRQFYSSKSFVISLYSLCQYSAFHPSRLILS